MLGRKIAKMYMFIIRFIMVVANSILIIVYVLKDYSFRRKTRIPKFLDN